MKWFAFLCFCFCSMQVGAQWNANASVNTVLANSVRSERTPMAASDGAGNGLVFFSSVYNDVYSVFAQKITTQGNLAWGSAINPVTVVSGATAQYMGKPVSDGAGGAYLAWEDFRDNSSNSEIYIQHINAAGTALWVANGMRVTNTATQDDAKPFLCSDGAGGVIVAWSWDDNSSNFQVNAQRYNAAGTAQWIAGGIQLCTVAGFRLGNGIVPDGSGGAIIFLVDSRDDANGSSYANRFSIVNYNLYAQRIGADGSLPWGLGGVAVCTAASHQNLQRTAAVASDGMGGALIVFDDLRNDVVDGSGFPTNVNNDIFAQRINGNGVPQWIANGIAVSTAAGNQYVESGAADAAAGMALCFNNNEDQILYAQRLSGAGSLLWAQAGVALSQAGEWWVPSVSTMAADGGGNFVYAFNTAQETIKAQKLNSNGVLQWGAGSIICNAANASPREIQMLLSDNAGFIFCWQDARNFDSNGFDLYADKILANGSLAAASFITVANGNWNDPATWGGQVPPTNAAVVVRHSVTITANTTCGSLKVEQPGGNIHVNAGVQFAVSN